MAHDRQVADVEEAPCRRSFDVGMRVRGGVRRWSAAGYGFIEVPGFGSVLLPVQYLPDHRAPRVGDVVEMTLALDKWGRWYGRDGHVLA